MKKKSLFEQKMLLQILSVVSAIILWFAVTYAENPSTVVPLGNINVKFIGEKSLENSGLIFVNRGELPNFTVEVRGKRTEVQSVLNSVSASVDLSDITEAGEYTKDVTYEVPNTSVMISKKKVTSVTVKIEKAVTKEVPLKVLQSGSNKDYLIKSTTEKQKIKISGTSEDLAKISSVTAAVDISEMQKDNAGEYQPIYTDRNNNAVTPANKITHEEKSITVKNEVYNKKTVKIELSPEYDKDNYQIEVKSFSTDKLEVGVKNGNVEVLYATFKENGDGGDGGKYEMNLEIPENVYCPQVPENLIMTATIENIITKEVQIPVTAENVGADLIVTEIDGFLTVSAVGTDEGLSKLKAIADLSDITEAGEYQIEPTYEGNGTVLGEHKVNVKIENNKNSNETE